MTILLSITISSISYPELTCHGNERDRRVCDRIKAVLLYDKGWSYGEIAEALLLSEEAIRKHVRDYQKFNKLETANGGSASKLSELEEKELYQLQ